MISGLGCDMWKMGNFHQMLNTVAGQYTNHIILHVMLMALFTITTLYEWPLSSNDLIIALHYEICDLVPWDFSHHLVAMWMSAAISVGFWLLFSEIFPLNCTVL